MPLRILWGDVEQPAANRWSRTDHTANRQVFNGYFDIIQQSSRVLGLSPGVYSTRTTWNTIMGDPTRASQGYLPNTWEWTAQHSRAAQPAPCPASFASPPHPLFFGGQTEASAHALMWQWSIGNADYDLIDTNRPGIPVTG